MAFLFKAAEDLFEKVDQRAKQVVADNLDKLPDIQKPASEQDLLGKPQVQSSNVKRPKKISRTKSLVKPNGSEKHIGEDITLLESNGFPNRDNSLIHQEKDAVNQSDTYLPVQIIQDVKLAESAVPEVQKASLHNDNEQKIDRLAEIPRKEDNEEAVSSSPTSNLQGITFDSSSGVDASDSLPVPESDQGSVKCNFASENGTVTVELYAENASPVKPPEKAGTVLENETDKGQKKKLRKEIAEAKPSPKPSILNELPMDETTKPTRGLEDLDEAQGLLKTAVSTGQSKEARLARVCAGLSSRLQEYKSENAQLEELLSTEREEKNLYDARVKELEGELSLAKTAASAVESEMADALASKNDEIEALMISMETLNRQAIVSEEKLVTLQENTESLIRNQKLTETRMIQTLREELASTERRAEEERAAHNATRMAAMEREAELEHRTAESSSALARIQRTVDERTQKAADLEHKVSMLEMECAALTQELQALEARSRREQKRPTEEASQTSQAWREEAERARQAQREAETKLSAMEAETQKMRVEISSMKRDAEQYSKQAQMELEKRYRELTDLLYLKQTQLESMTSEKAAAIFQLEKEAKRLRDLQAEAERNRNWRRSSTPWDEDDNELKPLEYELTRPLGLQHRPMVRSSIRKAAKILDSGAVSAGRFLWRHPLARLIFLFYLVFVHIFLLYLLHHLQEQAERFLSSREAAAAMGLAKSDLP